MTSKEQPGSSYYLKMHHVSLLNTTQLSWSVKTSVGLEPNLTEPDPFVSLLNDTTAIFFTAVCHSFLQIIYG